MPGLGCLPGGVATIDVDRYSVFGKVVWMPGEVDILKNEQDTPPEAQIDARYDDAPVPTILPIYPTRSLFALVFMGDGERFVRLFKRTWRRIPKEDRDLLLDQWKSDRKLSKRGSSVRPWPAISLRRKHRTFEESHKQGRITFGSAGSSDITFYAPAFEIMPDDVFCIVIAHELVHRVLIFENHDDKPRRGFGKAYWAREKKVHARVDDWGFNAEDCEIWCSENKSLLQELHWMVKFGLR